MNNAASPPTTAPLWERLRASFGRLIATFGAPAALALLSFGSRTARLNIVRQLLMLESFARKLLLIEAAAFELPRPPRGPRLITVPLHTGAPVVNDQRARTAPAPRAPDIANPETWRAQFALSLPRDVQMVSDHHAPRIRALWGDDTPSAAPPPAPAPARTRRPASFLIARRFEALRRVLNDPSPHVRRLAIAQRRVRRRSPELIRRYALAAPRSSVYDPRDQRLSIDIYARLFSEPALLDSG